MVVSRRTMPGAGTTLAALEAEPVGGAPGGRAILFVHENRGLVPYMEEVVGALASHGHLVVAPDLLSRLGGTGAAGPDATTRLVDEAVHAADLVATADALVADRRVVSWAIVGFCFGAEMGWTLACRRRPSAAVLLYGIGPGTEETAGIGCPVHAVYAEDDARVNDTVDPTLAGLGLAGVDVVAESYPGTRHAFHDHHRPERYDVRAATAAWARLVEFLERHASAPSTGTGAGR